MKLWCTTCVRSAQLLLYGSFFLATYRLSYTQGIPSHKLSLAMAFVIWYPFLLSPSASCPAPLSSLYFLPSPSFSPSPSPSLSLSLSPLPIQMQWRLPTGCLVSPNNLTTVAYCLVCLVSPNQQLDICRILFRLFVKSQHVLFATVGSLGSSNGRLSNTIDDQIPYPSLNTGRQIM